MTSELSPDSQQHDSSGSAPRVGLRRGWFPIVWPLLLVGVWWIVRVRSSDQGVPNALIHPLVMTGILGLVIWTLRSSGLSRGIRWALAVTALLLTGTFYGQLWPIRMEIDGDVGIVGWRWRWLGEPDRQLRVPPTSSAVAGEWKTTSQDYPRFLGNGYWAEVLDASIDAAQLAEPPAEKWRVKIGAGWSGFAVVGDYAFTQEQRGETELVSCYDVRDGSLVWAHADAARWDPRGGGALGGVGPRATPTVHEGRVFSQGATGILNCLDARSGDRVWSHDTLHETGAKNVMWGKSGSPLVVDDTVVVSVGGSDDNSLVAYAVESGEIVWSAGKLQSSYASPVLTTLAGVPQILTVNEGFLVSHKADDGHVLWQHPWNSNSGSAAATSQSVPVGEDRVFLSKGYGHGSALIQVTQTEGDGWATKPLWKGTGGIRPVMKTKMGNVVVRDGYVYGLDSAKLQCIELATGRPLWKKRRNRRIGHGQIMLAGDAILILSELGEVILVRATPERYQELASFQAIEGVTWNNPALSGARLLVRNAEEAACYELPLAESAGEL